MRTIGMLGGMSWESTAVYYRYANELVRERLGGVHSAQILLDSVDFADIEALQASGRWDEAGTLLAGRAAALQGAGADLVLICANTMHLVADEVEAAVTIPVLHIADVTGAAITRAELRRVGLLGTAFTMEQPFYAQRLARAGIETIVPDDGDRARVHRVIYEELVQGVFSPQSREFFREVIARLVAAGAQGVVLGCTELELLLGQADSPVPLFPTARLHVEAAVAAALA